MHCDDQLFYLFITIGCILFTSVMFDLFDSKVGRARGTCLPHSYPYMEPVLPYYFFLTSYQYYYFLCIIPLIVLNSFSLSLLNNLYCIWHV